MFPRQNGSFGRWIFNLPYHAGSGGAGNVNVAREYHPDLAETLQKPSTRPDTVLCEIRPRRARCDQSDARECYRQEADDDSAIAISTSVTLVFALNSSLGLANMSSLRIATADFSPPGR